MKTLDSHLTFIGRDEQTGRARCGFLTDLIDADDLPIRATLVGNALSLETAREDTVCFELPHVLILSINAGAEFWVANAGGSGDAWLIPLKAQA